MLIAALFITAKTWKQPVNRWTGKEEVHIYIYIHSQWNIELKKDEELPFAATWMDLEIIILNEVR